MSAFFGLDRGQTEGRNDGGGMRDSSRIFGRHFGNTSLLKVRPETTSDPLRSNEEIHLIRQRNDTTVFILVSLFLTKSDLPRVGCKKSSFSLHQISIKVN